MKQPIWVLEKDILATHEKLLARFGGSSGLRDANLLDSVLHRPQQMEAYGEKDLFTMAAALATEIIKNHPFLDGNKRTGFMSAYIFLGANGEDFDAEETSVVEKTLALAAGALTEVEYAEWLRVSCRKKKKKSG
ncbi:MAG: type II toxin-antitoxin system death-on-curing family toxin [Verrucomicrobia bacterium]|nr:type II toxin-antitoxin system death-on-curing family toxin [Verrucomicrobiota bacterium]